MNLSLTAAGSYIQEAAGRTLFLPKDAATVAIDLILTIEGLVYSILSVAALGSNKYFNQLANQTEYSRFFLAYPFQQLIKIFNPTAFRCDVRILSFEKPQGLVAYHFAYPMCVYAHSLRCDRWSWTNRHMASRAAFALAAVIVVICQMMDLTLGLVAALFTGLSFGYLSHKMNDFTLKQLTSTNLVHVACRGARAVINPHQKNLFQ